MRPGQRRRTHPRGVTLIEAMIAMVVLLIGLLGFASLQVITVRANQFSRRMTQASAMATDIEENIRRWTFNDPRLAPMATVTSLSDAAIQSRWDMGRADTPTYVAQFSEMPGDSHASTADALGAGYQGLSPDVDGDGDPEFTRYWNVFAADLQGTGTPNGVLVQIIVRWREPGTGFRQLTAMTFKPNPQAIFP
ncbi:MAG: prepilin-type N-terminal cleavage/methylation domain-containing protein [Myxococcaceae bacterium]|nr:prepilin-type N-terminal cleavage/methylation domain-containing protein [Myxococcaceae bacterium]MCI0673189.1 prepilin-type N-terminal cleavage/methylation domain-containing protein [Myxococcaceae bacterium]